MEFAWEPSIPTGGSELTARPEDYDGCPALGGLRVDYAPRFSSPGRSAVAAILAFGRYVSGSVTFSHAISPELASTISEFMRPVAIWPGPLDFQPQAIPNVPGTFELGSPVDAWPDAGERTVESPTRLVLPSSGVQTGHTFGRGFVVLPTNAHLLVPESVSLFRRLLPFLAAVVLVAEDLGIGVVALPAGVEHDARYPAVSEMLRTVGIRLTAASTA